jgi:hypothetical protein
MSTIRSIIVFNGGSAGDFLRTVCLEQLDNFGRYSINHVGMIATSLEDNYFKELCKRQQKTNQLQTLDQARCFAIENAHTYYDWFRDLTANLFYIDHDDSISTQVAQAFVDKRTPDNFESWVQRIMPNHTPPSMLSQITQDNFADILSIFWKRNIREWQSNPALTPIPFRDLFDLSSLTHWVEQLCGQPISNPDQLSATHQAWLSKNSKLAMALI